MNKLSIGIIGLVLFSLNTIGVSESKADSAYDAGRNAIEQMTGCFLVDYSYVETESLKDGYTVDRRVYDVNKDKSIKEWIYLSQTSENNLRLQHILFGTDLKGNFLEGSMLKHQAEDWEYNAEFLYDFTSPSHWEVKKLDASGQWTRKITNLDDGLRYQCSSTWSLDQAYPQWSCENYAPIPGRETRDMGRKDYNTLTRGTKLVVYGNSFLERQENTKTIHKDGIKTPLAKELGKNWFVRLPDSECSAAQSFVAERVSFWELLRDTWNEVFTGKKPFIEKTPQGQLPRFFRMVEIEDRYYQQDLSNRRVRKAAQKEILNLINEYREN